MRKFDYNTTNNTFLLIKCCHYRTTIKPDSPSLKLNDKQVFETLNKQQHNLRACTLTQCSYQYVAPLQQNEAFVVNKYIYVFT